jgi:hypothetical protein
MIVTVLNPMTKTLSKQRWDSYYKRKLPADQLDITQARVSALSAIVSMPVDFTVDVFLNQQSAMKFF